MEREDTSSAPAEFRKSFEIRWADLDANRHLRHSAYADYATHVRFAYLAENGFAPSRFAELGIGPALMREETRYLREIGPNDTISIDFKISGLSADGSRWRIVHHVTLPDGPIAARITVEGGWLELGRRRLTRPPAALVELLRRLPATAEFEVLPSASGSE